MLVTSIFYSIKEINHHFSNIQFVVCKCFQFSHVQNSVVWEMSFGNVFKRLVLQTRKNQGFFGKGLNFNRLPNRHWLSCVCSRSLFTNTVGKGVCNMQFLFLPCVSYLLELPIIFIKFKTVF